MKIYFPSDQKNIYLQLRNLPRKQQKSLKKWLILKVGGLKVPPATKFNLFLLHCVAFLNFDEPLPANITALKKNDALNSSICKTVLI